MRTINANWLKDELGEEPEVWNDAEYEIQARQDYRNFRNIIDSAPTIDAVKVVRCKDCKHFYCCSAIDRMFYCKHPSGLRHVKAVEEDSFCSYGERKDGDEAK